MDEWNDVQVMRHLEQKSMGDRRKQMDEILKLAKECGLLTSKATEASMGQKDFYRAAYNKAIKDVLLTWNGGITLSDIRALEKK